MSGRTDPCLKGERLAHVQGLAVCRDERAWSTRVKKQTGWLEWLLEHQSSSQGFLFSWNLDIIWLVSITFPVAALRFVHVTIALRRYFRSWAPSFLLFRLGRRVAEMKIRNHFAVKGSSRNRFIVNIDQLLCTSSKPASYRARVSSLDRSAECLHILSCFSKVRRSS